MTTYRGQDGSVSLAGTAVLEVQSWSSNPTLEALDDTAMGDVARTFKGGLANGTSRFTAHFDGGDTSGQVALINEILSGTPDGTVADIRFRVSATKYLSGAAVITGINVGAALGAIISAEFSVQHSGVWALTWA